jgi:23S rRNA (guanosine2251-2'-O)-methyltransferase
MRRVYGFHAVRELLRRRCAEVVWIEQNRRGPRRIEIEELCRTHQVPIRQVPPGALESSGVRAQGFAADAKALAAEAGSVARDEELLVLAEDLQDPRNLGALVRVCEAAGVGRLLVRQPGSSNLTPVASRAAAGAEVWLPFEEVRSWGATLEKLKQAGYWLYGLAVGGRPPWEFDLTGKVAFLVGGEERGLRALTRERCDALIGLPMRGQVDSLNLTTAAAAVLYEAVRQRWSRSGAKS